MDVRKAHSSGREGLIRDDSDVRKERYRTKAGLVAYAVLTFIAFVAVVVCILRAYPSPGSRRLGPIVPMPSCNHPVYCRGPLLAAVQSHEPFLFADCKTFVDMPLLEPPDVVLNRFSTESRLPSFNLSLFVLQHFDPAGSEIREVVPPDFVPAPSSLNGSYIVDATLRGFAERVHLMWKNLSRQYDISKYCGPECVSSLQLPYPFVVPGGRFREFYYWDSFWILQGLLASQLFATARHVILNIAHLIDAYGFMPNGARCYYLDRSQPPLLTQMVELYINATGDASILGSVLSSLEKEHNYFMTTHFVPVEEGDGITVALSRYYVYTDQPRPESFREDLATLKSTRRAAEDLYSNLAAGAETGWDYSSRWFQDFQTLDTIVTTNIAPPDLNSILLRNEELLSFWMSGAAGGRYSPFTDKAKSFKYALWANQRRDAMFKYLLFASQEDGFRDWDFVRNSSNTYSWYPSNILPLTVDSIVNRLTAAEVMNCAAGILNVYPGGVPASSSNTTQQWDLPNAWPPMQYLVVVALRKMADRLDALHCGGDAAKLRDEAATLVDHWVRTNYCGFQKYGIMFEKYDAKTVGSSGGGGEYFPQAGFGWTNGVILWMLRTDGRRLTAPLC